MDNTGNAKLDDATVREEAAKLEHLARHLLCSTDDAVPMIKPMREEIDSLLAKGGVELVHEVFQQAMKDDPTKTRDASGKITYLGDPGGDAIIFYVKDPVGKNIYDLMFHNSNYLLAGLDDKGKPFANSVQNFTQSCDPGWDK